MSMSEGLEVSGVKSAETAATYVYTISADSGYRANETGRISAERHGLVCRALAGKLDDYDNLLEQRAELLTEIERIADDYHPDKSSDAELALTEMREALCAAIANATQQRNATGGEG